MHELTCIIDGCESEDVKLYSAFLKVHWKEGIINVQAISGEDTIPIEVKICYPHFDEVDYYAFAKPVMAQKGRQNMTTFVEPARINFLSLESKQTLYENLRRVENILLQVNHPAMGGTDEMLTHLEKELGIMTVDEKIKKYGK